MLQSIEAHENQLTYFDLRNDVDPWSLSLNVSGNPDLFIILHLFPAYADGAWTFDNGNIDEQMGFYEHFHQQHKYRFHDEDVPYQGLSRL